MIYQQSIFTIDECNTIIDLIIKKKESKYISNEYEVYISSLLYSNGKIYVYDYLTNEITLLLSRECNLK